MSLAPQEAARTLEQARDSLRPVRAFTADHPTLDESWGYAVQHVDRETRLRAGERLVGAKLGLTSAAKQQRMGVDTPVFGFLTDAMLVGSVTDAVPRWAQPRIEPEIAFVTARDIAGPVTRDDAPS